MAQYLPYIPEVFPEPALYKPDFNFFDRMLQRKQSQFETGLSQARSAHNSVLNAPLSDKANIPLRDSYLKEAQDNLKKYSSLDLSLPENVQTIQNLYSPFWEDKFIVQDAALTKWYQGEASKVASWRDSPDDKVRSKYNDIAMMYLSNGLSALQNANRNPDAYAKVEKRQAVPFTNIEQYLQEQATKDKLEIKYDDPNGPYLVETINGERSQKKYSTWAQSIIGNNFYGQFRVTGIVEKEERAKAIKRSNPNLSDDEIGTLIADDVVKELKGGYQKRMSEVDVEVARIDSLLKSIAESNNPDNKNLFEQLVTERTNQIAKKEAVNAEYEYFNQGNKDKIKSAVVTNPDGYFATLAKQRLIDNWATGRASVESKVIKENNAYTSAENIRLQRDQKLWERVNAKPGTGTKTTTIKDKDGNDITVPVEGQNEEKSLMYKGFSGLDITKNALTAYDVFNKLQEKEFLESYNLIFDQKGILGLATNLGLDRTEIAHLATALQAEVRTAGGHTFTKEQAAASNKLAAALLGNPAVKNAGITKITGPGTMRNALIAYASDYFSERGKLTRDGFDVPFNKDETEMMFRYSTAVQKLETYTANEKNREELIRKNILTDKKYSHLVVEKDGKKDLVTISDVAKDMQPLTLAYKDSRFGDEKVIVLSKEDVAKAYMTGKISDIIHSRGAGNHIRYNDDGRYYRVRKVGDTEITPGWEWEKPWNDWWKGVTEKYKDPTEFSKDMLEANTKIVPDLLRYRGQTGKQGSAFTLTFMPTKTMAAGDNAAAIVNQASSVANSEIYDGNMSDPQRVDANTAKSLRAFLSMEKNIEEWASAEYIPQGIGGKRTVRVTFGKPTSDEDKNRVGDVFMKELSGNSFNIVVNDDANAPAINNLPNNTGYQVYDGLSRGKVLKADPVISASGFDYTLTPNIVASQGGADVEPDYVTLDLSYNLRENKKDPATGALTTTVKPIKFTTTFNLRGDKAKSPDEIMTFLHGLYVQNLELNRQKKEEYTAYTQAQQNAQNAQNVDYKKKLIDAGLGHLVK